MTMMIQNPWLDPYSSELHVESEEDTLNVLVMGNRCYVEQIVLTDELNKLYFWDFKIFLCSIIIFLRVCQNKKLLILHANSLPLLCIAL